MLGKKIAGLLIVLSVSVAVTAQTTDESKVLAKIRAEGFQNSKIMPAVEELTDFYGPRLTASPNLKKAQRWIVDLMNSWGIENSRIEPWGEFGNGWTLKESSFEMIAPTYDRLNAIPLAWSPSIEGTVTGEPMLVSISGPSDFDKYRGKLKGKIVFSGSEPSFDRFAAPGKRIDEKGLEKAVSAVEPTAPGIDGDRSVEYREEDADWQAYLAQKQKVIDFLRYEGVAVLVQPSAFPYGIVRAAGFYNTDPQKNLPAFVIGREQFGRVSRLLSKGKAVDLKVSLKTDFSADKTGYNVIGELVGSDPKLKDQLVMIGGHFDSWHGGTGAADNGANCIVMLEALRILKTVGVKPRRTIRVGLWSGEEQDYFGSYNYVKKNFGDPKTGEKKPGHSLLSAYFNLDNGGGKIRGIFSQGNEQAADIFRNYFARFSNLDADTVTILNTGGTDHMVFDGIGLPGFQFIQDPLDYNTRVHHSNMDVFESLEEGDLKQNAVIVASIVYLTAMRDEMIPRE
ncbi:MAG: M20/M25/M40 family metallo-hydrolase [Pyrinomonadaceae bacterium]